MNIEAIALQPDYVAAYNQLGNALQGLGESEQVITCYQRNGFKTLSFYDSFI